MAVLCTGRLMRHDGSFHFTVRSPLPSALTYALWGRCALRFAIATATARQASVMGQFFLYDAEGTLALAPQTVDVIPAASSVTQSTSRKDASPIFSL